MKVIEIEGKTVDAAKKKALKQLEVDDVSLVDIEVLDEGKSGIFGIGVSRKAKIRVSYNVNAANISSQTESVVRSILDKMGFEKTEIDIKEGESKVYVELKSKEQSAMIIGRKGKTLDALQFMVNLIIHNQTGTEKKIVIDIESYRGKRERALKKMAKDIAEKVLKSGKPWTLEPMNPFERRLVHMTLENDDRITTKSEGHGIYRKVIILPNNAKKK